MAKDLFGFITQNFRNIGILYDVWRRGIFPEITEQYSDAEKIEILNVLAQIGETYVNRPNNAEEFYNMVVSMIEQRITDPQKKSLWLLIVNNAIEADKMSVAFLQFFIDIKSLTIKEKVRTFDDIAHLYIEVKNWLNTFDWTSPVTVFQFNDILNRLKTYPSINESGIFNLIAEYGPSVVQVYNNSLELSATSTIDQVAGPQLVTYINDMRPVVIIHSNPAAIKYIPANHSPASGLDVVNAEMKNPVYFNLLFANHKNTSGLDVLIAKHDLPSGLSIPIASHHAGVSVLHPELVDTIDTIIGLQTVLPASNTKTLPDLPGVESKRNLITGKHEAIGRSRTS